MELPRWMLCLARRARDLETFGREPYDTEVGVEEVQTASGFSEEALVSRRA